MGEPITGLNFSSISEEEKALQWAIEKLRRLTRSQFFGTVTLTMQNGIIGILEERQTIKRPK